MDTITKFISLAAAACFVWSAAFLFGRLSGMGRLDLVWFLTFSDFVNYAPAALLVYGISVATNLILDNNIVQTWGKTHENPISRKVIWAIVGVIVTLAGALIWFAWGMAIFLITVLSIFVYLTVTAVPFARREFGHTAAIILDKFLLATVGAIVIGYSIGASTSPSASGVSICTTSGIISGNNSMPLDRGMVLVSKGSYQLIPWDKITAIEHSNAVTDQHSLPSSIFSCPAVGTDDHTARIIKSDRIRDAIWAGSR